MRGKTPRPSGTSAMPWPTSRCGASLEISSPRRRTLPPAASMRRASAFSVLVLPAPLAPISATISPCFTWKLMPRTAWMPP